CCTDGTEQYPSGVIGIGVLESGLARSKAISTSLVERAVPRSDSATANRVFALGGSEAALTRALGAVTVSAPGREGPPMTAREANELAAHIREGFLQLHTSRESEGMVPVPYI